MSQQTRIVAERTAKLGGLVLTIVVAGLRPSAAYAQPPEDRTYIFDVESGTFEQLIDAFARQTGLGVIGQPPTDTRVDLVTPEELTFAEALARVRMLLVNARPDNPYWLVRYDTHLEVLPINDVLQILSDERMFRSVEEYRAADLPEEELVLVVYTPRSGSVSDLMTIRDFMPDYVRTTPLEDQNAVAIFALIGDIEKYLSLVDFFAHSGDDPRTLEVIEVQHIPPSQAVDKLRLLMDLDSDGVTRSSRRGRPGRRTSRRTPGRQPGAVDALPEPEVSVLPDDPHGVIIVRAMADKIEEIQLLLPYLDVDTSSDLDPVVVPLEHVDAAEVLGTVQAILAASEGRAASAKARKRSPARRSRRSRKSRRSKKRSRPVQTVMVGDLSMMVHPADNAIIVIGDDQDTTRVRQLIELLDVTDDSGPVRIDLQYADAPRIANSLAELLGLSNKRRRDSSVKPSIVPDSSGDALWFEGSEGDLAIVRELVESMDRAEDAVSLHIATVRNQSPVLVANLLREYDGEGTPKRRATRSRRGRTSRRATRRRSSRRPTRSRPVAVAKFTPNEQQNCLYVLCTEEEWAEYEVIIEQLEGSVDEAQSAVRLPLAHLDPQEAIGKLTTLFGDRRQGLRFATAENDILISGASPAQIQSIKEVLAELDTAPELVQRTFEIEHADPAELMAAIRSLVAEQPASPRPRSRRGRSRARRRRPAGAVKSAELTVARMGDHLIVETTVTKMEEVAALIDEFDRPQHETELRTYDDFPPGTDLDDMAMTLSSIVNGTGRLSRGKVVRGSRSEAKAQFVPQPESGKLIVRAEPPAFAETEAFLEVLRPDEGIGDVEVAYVDVGFRDPEELARAIDPLLSLKVRELISTGQLEDRPVRSVPRVRGRRRGRARPSPRESPHYLIVPDARNQRIVVASRPAVIDEATELIAILDQPGDQPDQVEVNFIDVEFADPVEVVEAIDPVLSLKTRELAATGELSDEPLRSVPRVRRRRGRRTPRTLQRNPYYHLAADARNARIVIAAPQSIIHEAVELVAAFDEPGGADDPIVRTVELENTDPAEMVRAVGELKGIRARRASRRGRQRRPAPIAAATDRFSVLVAPGGGAVVVRGEPEEVEQTLTWIAQLDAMSSSGRAIKVYEVKHLDLVRLGDLLMNTFDAADRRRTRGLRRARHAPPPAEENAFTLDRTWVGKDVYLQADLIDRTMLVSASERKLAQIDEIIGRLDTEEEADALAESSVPRRFYELEHADALEAAFELELVLEVMWEPSDRLPGVVTAPFGNALVVSYPDQDRFPEIEELIRQYVDKADPEGSRVSRRAVAVPRGMTAEEFVEWLRQSRPDAEIQLESLAEDEDYGVTEVQPQTRPQP